MQLLKLTSNARNDVESLKKSKKIKRHPRYATIYKQKKLIKGLSTKNNNSHIWNNVANGATSKTLNICYFMHTIINLNGSL